MEETEIVKSVIVDTLAREGIKKVRVILFGSWAQGGAESNSDWDLLVLIDAELSPQKRREVWSVLYHSLHNFFPQYSFDILVKNFRAFEEEKLVVNTIAHEVYLEGIEV